MDKKIIDQLFTLYVAGFNHGHIEGINNQTGIVEAFDRIMEGLPPLEYDNHKYDISELLEYLNK